MAVRIQLESETGIAICICTGVLRFEDAIKGAKLLWQTPGWNGQSAVWDFRKSKFDMSSTAVEKVAQFVLHNQPSIPPLKMAFVAPSDLEYGLSRIFEAYRQDENTNFQVFRDYEEALNWVKALEPGPA